MSDIYLVGGLTPRTDLDNYQSAFISREKAEKSKEYWNSFHEDNDYDEYHIDSIEIEDLAEHDKQIRADAIEEFQEWLKTQVVGIDNTTKEILVVDGDKWELATGKYIEQLKEESKC